MAIIPTVRCRRMGVDHLLEVLTSNDDDNNDPSLASPAKATRSSLKPWETAFGQAIVVQTDDVEVFTCFEREG